MMSAQAAVTDKDTRSVLLAAQQASARKDYKAAVAAFSDLIDNHNLPNAALALLSRSTCFMEIKSFEAAISDCRTVLSLPNVQLPDEIAPGCYATHPAAAARLSQCYTKLGDKKSAEVFKMAVTEMLKKEASNTERAVELKESGNSLFKDGKVMEAVEKWEEALKLDRINSSVLSNLSLAYLKLNELDKAAEMAERCTLVNPKWPKAWLRKGNVDLKRKKYTAAAHAFQCGLEHAPDDALLKKAYMEASTLAEKSPSNGSSNSRNSRRGDGFDKRIMGMMMDLRYKSWDLKQFFKSEKNQPISYFDFKNWDKKVVPQLSDTKFAEFVEKTMRLIYPNFRRGMSPVGLNPYFKPDVTATSWISYTVPNAPLITALLYCRLFNKAYPEFAPWSMVWTHSCVPPSEAKLGPVAGSLVRSSLLPHLKKHGTYASIVSKKAKTVVDFMAMWADDVGGDAVSESTDSGSSKGRLRWWLPRLAVDESEDDVEEDADGKKPAKWTAPTFYTCDDEQKVFEFLESYYQGLEEQPASGVDNQREEKAKGNESGMNNVSSPDDVRDPVVGTDTKSPSGYDRNSDEEGEEWLGESDGGEAGENGEHNIDGGGVAGGGQASRQRQQKQQQHQQRRAASSHWTDIMIGLGVFVAGIAVLVATGWFGEHLEGLLPSRRPSH
ncbi:hypothetical protein DFJ73DRAFT_810418 [Zopfochytrium polystomum]|nr:hypothetical protein DFJ73DRAFT_810418 [Zopfochytrium polystomum]